MVFFRVNKSLTEAYYGQYISMDSKGGIMEQKLDNEIKALNTYYEMANSEYDRIHNWFDQIDNKVGFLIAVVIGVPIATIGFASQLKHGDIKPVAFALGALGIVAFLGAGWNIIQAVRVRGVKLGIPYKEFKQYSKEYEDADMREWVANILVKSSEFNYAVTLRKAKYLNAITIFLACEVILLLSAIIYVLISKL